MEFNYNDLIVKIDECGSVTIMDGTDRGAVSVFLGESQGMRFQTVLRAMNVGVELTKLNDVVQKDGE